MRPERVPFVPLPIDVKILPDQERLSAVVRELHHTKRAYPLAEIAKCFIAKPEYYRIKIESTDPEDKIRAFQCKKCQLISSKLEDMGTHFIKEHIDSIFDTQEVEVEGITGSFVCVGRCGMSGEIFGPSNHHSYSVRVEEVHASKFPNMPIER